MEKLHCVICRKYLIFKKPKISYLSRETLVLFIICSKCKNEDAKKLRKKSQLRY